MALKPLMPVITTPATPYQCSLSPYKRVKSNPGPHHPFPPSLPSSLTPSFALAPSSSHRRSSPPSRRLSAAAHALVSNPPAVPCLARPPPPSSMSTSEPLRPCADRAPPRPFVRAASVDGGPEPRHLIHAPWTWSTRFSIRK
jgi:hypothetical protein